MSDISDLMNKFSDMMNNSKDNSVNSNSGNSSGFNASKISPEMINSFAGMFSSSSSSNGENSSIDMETILKLKNIMEKMNSSKKSADSNLLSSLKPYLKESRKAKVDQYINILAMSKAMNLFNGFGGGNTK